MATKSTLAANKTQHAIRVDFGMKENEIVTMGMSKKEHDVQWKA
jgi:hypothetical protein